VTDRSDYPTGDPEPPGDAPPGSGGWESDPEPSSDPEISGYGDPEPPGDPPPGSGGWGGDPEPPGGGEC
jgi:hypothetical protein